MRVLIIVALGAILIWIGLGTGGGSADAPTDQDLSPDTETASSDREYRFPLDTQDVPGTTRQREPFSGSLLVDTGLLGPEASGLDIEQTRVSKGFAIGGPFPVTFSFGWPLMSEEDERQTFSFSLTSR